MGFKNHLRVRITFWLLFTFSYCTIYSQPLAHWVIGRNASLIFEENEVYISNQTMVSDFYRFNSHSTVTLLQSSKGLVFFTDGIHIYDSSGNRISTQELSGNDVGPLATLIVQNPNNKTQYYVFAMARWIANGERMHYSIIDASDPSYPTVIGDENIAVPNSANLNYIVGAYNHCNDSYWIISADVNAGLLYAFPITSSGISDPIISNLSGSIPLDRFPNFGGITYNADRQLIAIFHRGRRELELLKFLPDGSTKSLRTLASEEKNLYPHTAVFSKNGDELIVGELFDEGAQQTHSWNLYKYDLKGINTSIPKTSIGQTELIGILSNLNIGPDGNYYFINETRDTSFISKASVGRIEVSQNHTLDTRFLTIDSDSFNLVETWGTIQNTVVSENAPITLPELIVQDEIIHCFEKNEGVRIESMDVDSIIWSTGETLSNITVYTPDSYSIEGFLRGCTITDTITITEDPDCPPDIADCHTYLPNAISTISTQGNDAFYPQSNCPLYDYQMSIYDRWGGRVYHSSDPTQRWEGSSTDQAVTPGIYSYITHYRYAPDAEIIRHSGTVTVIR